MAIACAGVARAQSVSGELRVGGGWDSNPSFAAEPSNRRVPTGRAPPAPGAGLFAAAGFASTTVGEELALRARLDVDARVLESGDAIGAERARIDGLWELAPVLLRCGVDGARFDSGLTDEGAWTVGGSCGARVSLPEGFWIGGDLRAHARAFDVGQLDAIYGGSVGGGWSLAPVAIELGFVGVRRDSDEHRAERADLSPFAEVRVASEHVGGFARYELVAREFDRGAQSGLEHVGRAALWGMPLPWLGAFVEVELGFADGEEQALAYERVAVVGGIRLALEWRAPRAPEPDGPAVAEGGRVRFRISLPEASAVAVVGDFNGWDEHAGALRETSDGVFEGAFPIAPGRHAYSLIVDGQPMTPPGARRTVDDGFGGRNAILVVAE